MANARNLSSTKSLERLLDGGRLIERVLIHRLFKNILRTLLIIIEIAKITTPRRLENALDVPGMFMVFTTSTAIAQKLKWTARTWGDLIEKKLLTRISAVVEAQKVINKEATETSFPFNDYYLRKWGTREGGVGHFFERDASKACLGVGPQVGEVTRLAVVEK